MKMIRFKKYIIFILFFFNLFYFYKQNIRLQQVKDNKHRYMANKFEERGKKAEILNNVKQEFRSYSVL